MTTHRYDTLDALRGVAAVVVLLFHLATRKMAPPLLPHGYLAVDFFFILSGVVLAHAYEARFGHGLDLRGFIVRRVIRLYPLVLAGAVVGLVVRLARYLADPATVDPLGQVLVAGLLNAGLVPMPYGSELTGRSLFPTDGPLWSLFFEVLANLAWVTLLVRRKTAVLLLVLLASAVLYAVCIRHYGTANIGSDRDTFFAALPRVTFGFVAGVLLYRLRHQLIHHLRPPGGPWVAPALGALLVVALMPAPSAVWDMACVFVILPAVVALGLAPATVPSPKGAAAVLGRLSYPLYVLHYPVLVAVIEIARTQFPTVSRDLVGLAAMAAALVVAWVALVVYDEPVRAALSRRLLAGQGRRSTTAMPTSVV
ncbi:MAG: acyltransferase [Burkholderiales bacterium]|nr:acyltransferase [Burkholderiales bacterium]